MKHLKIYESVTSYIKGQFELHHTGDKDAEVFQLYGNNAHKIQLYGNNAHKKGMDKSLSSYVGYLEIETGKLTLEYPADYTAEDFDSLSYLVKQAEMWIQTNKYNL